MSLSPHPTLGFSHLFGSPREEIRQWLPAGRMFWFEMGRQAIFAALGALRIPPGSKVLMPAYQCPAALDPFLAAGMEPVYYDISPHTLRPDLNQLDTLMGRLNPAMIMAIHFYGFPMSPWTELVDLAARHRLRLLEDCAHAMFSTHDGTPLGSWGDAGVFSLAKSLPVDVGGILILKHRDGAPPAYVGTPAGDWQGMLRLLAYTLEGLFPVSLRTMMRSVGTVDELVRRRMETPADGRELCLPRPAGRWSRHIAARIQAQRIVERRRANYLAVLDAFNGGPPVVQPTYPVLPPGVCPLACPVLIAAQRDEVMRRLWRRGVPVRAMWDRLPQQIPEADHPGASHLRARILTLPVHQNLRPDQAREIAAFVVDEARAVRAT